MTLRHLKIFVSVCDNGGITRASEALHITQPAVSHTIAELEKYYNLKLFDRINQRLVITEKGKEILSKARAVVTSFDEFEEFASLGGNDPRVKVGSSLTLGQTVIPSYIKKIREEHPQIDPKIVIRPAAVIISGIERGDYDFALVEGEVSSPNIKKELYMEDRLIFVANSNYDIPTKLAPNKLIEYPLIIRESASSPRTPFDIMMSKYTPHIEPLLECENNQAIVAALYASTGVALMPESFVKGHIERGKFKEITIEGFNGKQNSYIIIHKNKHLNSIGREAYDILKKI